MPRTRRNLRTQGSFYHHHDAKDDLVLQCFQRSYDRLSKVQMAGHDVEGSYWTRLASILNELLQLQFFDSMPLLRTTALQALDSETKVDVVMKANMEYSLKDNADLRLKFSELLTSEVLDDLTTPVRICAHAVYSSTCSCRAASTLGRCSTRRPRSAPST